MRVVARIVAAAALGLTGAVVPASMAQAVEASGSVPTVVTPCHVDYRVVANVDTYGNPPVKTSGTDVGVECP